MMWRTALLFCAMLRHAAADCAALGCVLTAGEHTWSAIVRGDEWTLSLSISEEQDSAAGSLLRGGVAEAVSAAVTAPATNRNRVDRQNMLALVRRIRNEA